MPPTPNPAPAVPAPVLDPVASRMFDDVLRLARGGNVAAREALDEYGRQNRTLRGRAVDGSIDEKGRSIEFIASTETPVLMPDYDRWEMIPEVLVASGFSFLGGADSVPFIDSHDLTSIDRAFGRARNWRTESSKVLARVFFGSDDDSLRAFGKYRDGTLSDVSVGPQHLERIYVPEKTTQVIGGVAYTGPVNVVTVWTVRELSACAVGKDPFAKVRAFLAPQNLDSNPSARAAGTSQQEGSNMDPVTQQPGSPPANPTPPVATEADVTAAEERGRRAESTRRQQIEQIGTLAQCARSIFEPFMNDPTRSVAEAQAAIMADHASRHAPPAPTSQESRGATGGIGVISVSGDKGDEAFMLAAEHALVRRAGIVGPDGKRIFTNPHSGLVRSYSIAGGLHPEHERYMSSSLVDLAASCVRRFSGGKIVFENKVELRNHLRNRAAQGASQFGTLLENAMNKALLAGWETANTTWRQVARVESVTDMRERKMYKTGQFSRLVRIGVSSEVPRQKLPDGKKEVYTPAQYGSIITFGDILFYNDDLGFLTRALNEFGGLSDLTINDWVWYMILSNPTMTEDGGTLFNSTAVTSTGGHANLAGSGGVFGDTAIKAGVKAIELRKGPNGRVLRLSVGQVWAPPDIKYTVLQQLNSSFKVGGTNQEPNIFQNLGTPVFEPLLSQGVTVETEEGPATASGSATAWYLATNQNNFGHVVVGFLGAQQPQLISQQEFDILGTSWRQEIIFGTGLEDWRGLYKDPGA